MDMMTTFSSSVNTTALGVPTALKMQKRVMDNQEEMATQMLNDMLPQQPQTAAVAKGQLLDVSV